MLYRASRQAANISELYALLKSKRYTLARCKRICLCAMLRIDKRLVSLSQQDGAGYLHVLGFRREARGLVSAIGQKCALPLLMRRSDAAKLSLHAQSVLEADIRAHEIYGLLCGGNHPIADFAAPPLVL